MFLINFISFIFRNIINKTISKKGKFFIDLAKLLI